LSWSLDELSLVRRDFRSFGDFNLGHMIHVPEDEIDPGLVARAGTTRTAASLASGRRPVTLYSPL
jgi:hypothetical protein